MLCAYFVTQDVEDLFPQLLPLFSHLGVCAMHAVLMCSSLGGSG